jgi:glutaredoxin-related protein
VLEIGRCGYSVAVVGILNHKCQRMNSIMIDKDRDVIDSHSKTWTMMIVTPLDLGAKPMSL